MDTQKDSQKTDEVIKFLDYQTLKSNPFGNNRVGERLYRHAERLASAVVLLTVHVSESDVLRAEARKSVLEVLSKALAVRDQMRSPNSHEVNDLKIAVRKVISMLRLLGIAGSISFQNVEIITEALDDLMSFISVSRRSNLSDSVSFSKEDLFGAREAQRFVEDRRPQRVDREGSESKEASATATGTGEGSTSSSAISSRARSILEVLRVHGELGIRDVASNLPEYSEKMIQRELVDLVRDGHVKKTGLKRWSRYTHI